MSRRFRARAWPLLFAVCLTGRAAAQAPLVTGVRVEQEGRPVDDPTIVSLIETRAGAPFSARLVRETISHLVGLGLFEDVRVFQAPSPGGIEVRFDLVPVHPIDRLEFRGDLGLSENVLRRVVTEQFGDPPRVTQPAPLVELLRVAYRDRGYPAARVEVAFEETHVPDRTTLAVTVAAGTRAIIGDVRFDYVRESEAGGFAERPDVRVGQPYERAAVERELQRWEARMRGQGYYEARATHGVAFPPDGAFVSISLARGPRVVVAFTGDALPAGERERLVPIRAEASADEDLLEDSALAIEGYLRARGYRDAAADYTQTETGGQLTITFAVGNGPRFTIGDLTITGQRALPLADIRTLLGVAPGDAFVQATLDTGVRAVLNAYRVRGYARAAIERRLDEVVPEDPADRSRRVLVSLAIAEGERTLVRNVVFEGSVAVPESALRPLLVAQPGRPFSDADLEIDRDRIEEEYRNRGYARVRVTPEAASVDDGRGADLRFAIEEGPLVVVDRVIVTGYRRTRRETIERELVIRPGEPLGFSKLMESRSRLGALGLFRRAEVLEIPHGTEPRVDLLVRVEEARPTTVGGGGGFQFGSRARAVGDTGVAEDRYELVPRGFFEVGRRNLWGSTRAVNLFTRVSLRARDLVVDEAGNRLDPIRRGDFGLNEYRVVGTFREPRVAGTSAEALVTGILERAIRSSFTFERREARVETGVRMASVYSLTGRYSLRRTELFDEQLTPDEQPLIDRLFPQVRLSTFTGSLLRDTRDDVLDASRGTLVLFETDISGRAVGSEVGFVKSYVQGSTYHRLPGGRRVVVALNGRLGAARGFTREVTRVGAGGTPVVETVADLPASERFFAGGDTTVRGFSLDRLGDDATISSSGFPTGGNGLIVLNGELRVGVTGPLQAVGFLDAGNVVRRVSDLRLTDLRAAAGFGVRYGSPFGPIRLDWGFKLDRRELSPGRFERGSRIHISLGQAF